MTLQINDIVKVHPDCKGSRSWFIGDYGRIFSCKNGIYEVIFECSREGISWEEEYKEEELIKVGHEDDDSLYVNV